MDNIIQLSNINKVYGDQIKTQVLFDLNLAFEKGSFNSIIGASGSGKSTLLNIMGTLDQPTSGEVIINGYRSDRMTKDELAVLRNETIGFIFQFHHLLPEFTALENILLPMRIKQGFVTSADMRWAEELLELVGLTKWKNNLATNLSGGQQQRTAIARGLMNSPKIILADEPTGNLDSDSTDKIYSLLQEINQRLNTTLIVITHDRRIAEKTQRIVEIKDGRIHLDL